MLINAHAKVNLALGVTGKAGDMHLLDMLVATVSLHDKVEVNFRQDGRVFCVMDGAEQDENNSAVRAARLIMGGYGLKGADIIIKKGIPFRAGLGGSTADGVAVARAYAKQFGLDIDAGLLLKLGSDAPYMYRGGLCRVRGIGERVEPVDKRLNLNLAILVAEGGVDTAAAYKLYDRIGGEGKGAAAVEAFLRFEDFSVLYNDLERAAEELNPNIAQAAELLKKLSPLAVVMSGSGSAVAAYFKGDIPKNRLNNIIYTKII